MEDNKKKGLGMVLVLRESAKWTNRKVQSTDTVIGAEWLVVVKRVSEKKTERRSHSIQAE